MNFSGKFTVAGFSGLILFAALTIIFVVPSFPYGGVDCVSGCVRSVGIPFAYRTVFGGGIAQAGVQTKFAFMPLLADLAIWAGVSALFTLFTAGRPVVRYTLVALAVVVAVLAGR